MTDTDRMVVWLRETLDAAQRDAEAAARDTEPDWSDGGEYGESVTTEPHGEYVVVGPWDCPVPDGVRRHIARHDPAAVLRRIAADRKTLDDCDDVVHDFVFGAFRKLAEDTICNLAEGWGWTEGE